MKYLFVVETVKMCKFLIVAIMVLAGYSAMATNDEETSRRFARQIFYPAVGGEAGWTYSNHDNPNRYFYVYHQGYPIRPAIYPQGYPQGFPQGFGFPGQSPPQYPPTSSPGETENFDPISGPKDVGFPAGGASEVDDLNGLETEERKYNVLPTNGLKYIDGYDEFPENYQDNRI